jgi:hypothetical protein
MSGNLLNKNMMSSILGGGIAGSQQTLLGGGASSNGGSGMAGGIDRSIDRTILRQAFGNSYLTYNIRSPQWYVANNKSKTTPFRAAFSAGDINGSYNSAASKNIPGNNQVSAPRVQGTQNNPGSIQSNGNSYYTGNPTFVYDGSDYTRYKRLVAVNKTYDDSSYGGSNNGSYTFLRAVRRF